MTRYYVDCPECGKPNVIAEDPAESLEFYRTLPKEEHCESCNMTLDKSEIYSDEG